MTSLGMRLRFVILNMNINIDWFGKGLFHLFLESSHHRALLERQHLRDTVTPGYQKIEQFLSMLEYNGGVHSWKILKA